MNIHLTETQPPRLVIECTDSEEFRAVRGSAIALHGNVENLEVVGLEPVISSQMVKGLQKDIATAATAPESGWVTFDTHPDQQDTLRAAAVVALNTLERRLESETTLIAGHQQDTSKVDLKMNSLFGAIRAWKERVSILSGPAEVRTPVTANPV